MEVDLGPDDFVLDGDPALSSPKRGGACGQTVGWINMVLGIEIGLSPGDFALNGDQPAP